jgi:hypothetical protein
MFKFKNFHPKENFPYKIKYEAFAQEYIWEIVTFPSHVKGFSYSSKSNKNKRIQNIH